MHENPFNITKAVDFDDSEILRYWVDLSQDGNSFEHLLKPQSAMPMLVLGGKGSGKTHIMRYYSYEVYKQRYASKNIIQQIQKDKFLGIYFRCNGINANRFGGKKHTEDQWGYIFQYCFDLWLAQKLLSVVIDLLKTNPLSADQEGEIVSDIKNIPTEQQSLAACSTLKDILIALHKIQVATDSIVNNCGFGGNLADIHIVFSPSQLIFGIPQILRTHISFFRDTTFVYLIDEYENLNALHQKCVNSYVREKERPCSFKIGARLYGMKTYETLSESEILKQGSEYEVLYLDEEFRNHEKEYKKFVINLIVKRLVESKLLPPLRDDSIDGGTILSDYFQGYRKTNTYAEETAFLARKSREERKYYKDFVRKCKGLLPIKDVNAISKILHVAEIPYLDACNIYLFYRKYKKGSDPIALATEIAKRTKEKIAKNQVLDEHFGKDFLARLLHDSSQSQIYLGVEEYITMSKGIVRNLLIILKNIYRWSRFNGDTPFEHSNGKITIDSQLRGVTDAAEWFFSDARSTGKDSIAVRRSIKRLAALLREIRYSDKPSECSVISFSGQVSEATPNAQHIIHMATAWSLLIDVGEKAEKNSKGTQAKYQLNPMLSPVWELPIYSRGTINLNVDELNAIFDNEKDEEFESLKKAKIERMTFEFVSSAQKGKQVEKSGDIIDLFSSFGEEN